MGLEGVRRKVLDGVSGSVYSFLMTNTNNPALFSRVRALLVARKLTDSKLIWAGYNACDHVFTTPTGAEIHVDLVLNKAWYGQR